MAVRNNLSIEEVHNKILRVSCVVRRARENSLGL